MTSDNGPTKSEPAAKTASAPSEGAAKPKASEKSVSIVSGASADKTASIDSYELRGRIEETPPSGDKVALVPITITHDAGQVVEVAAADLKTDDEVILDPSDSLIEGQQVHVAQVSQQKQAGE